MSLNNVHDSENNLDNKKPILSNGQIQRPTIRIKRKLNEEDTAIEKKMKKSVQLAKK
jgi:hypothetical protein